jgi:hypothetical protein
MAGPAARRAAMGSGQRWPRRAVHRRWPAIRRKPLSRRDRGRYRGAVLSMEAKVSTESSYQWRKQILWGLLLIGFGTMVLLDRLGWLEFDQLWHYWPWILVVAGVNKMIGFPSARDFTSGLWNVFIGLWLFANLEAVFGLTFHNSWPLLIIAWGLSLIVEPLIRRRFQPNSESRHET